MKEKWTVRVLPHGEYCFGLYCGEKLVLCSPFRQDLDTVKACLDSLPRIYAFEGEIA